MDDRDRWHLIQHARAMTARGGSVWWERLERAWATKPTDAVAMIHGEDWAAELRDAVCPETAAIFARMKGAA